MFACKRKASSSLLDKAAYVTSGNVESRERGLQHLEFAMFYFEVCIYLFNKL